MKGIPGGVVRNNSQKLVRFGRFLEGGAAGNHVFKRRRLKDQPDTMLVEDGLSDPRLPARSRADTLERGLYLYFIKRRC